MSLSYVSQHMILANFLKWFISQLLRMVWFGIFPKLAFQLTLQNRSEWSDNHLIKFKNSLYGLNSFTIARHILPSLNSIVYRHEMIRMWMHKFFFKLFQLTQHHTFTALRPSLLNNSKLFMFIFQIFGCHLIRSFSYVLMRIYPIL